MILSDLTAIEVASIGREGFIDTTSILSTKSSPYEVECQTNVVAERIVRRAALDVGSLALLEGEADELHIADAGHPVRAAGEERAPDRAA